MSQTLTVDEKILLDFPRMVFAVFVKFKGSSMIFIHPIKFIWRGVIFLIGPIFFVFVPKYHIQLCWKVNWFPVVIFTLLCKILITKRTTTDVEDVTVTFDTFIGKDNVGGIDDDHNNENLISNVHFEVKLLLRQWLSKLVRWLWFIRRQEIFLIRRNHSYKYWRLTSVWKEILEITYSSVW